MPSDSVPGALCEWFETNARDLPWRHTNDPYKIWVSEIMLQQTQVSTVIDYYNRFIDRFPDVESLATADRDEVLNCWEGLGYYARARWLHDAAGTVVDEFGGQLPDDHDERTTLKGIGEYTAAAIGALAFDQAEPVIDGNVLRVVTRVKGIREPIDRTDTERRVASHLREWLSATGSPGKLSEGLMELGALVCTPSNPDCEQCPIGHECQAFELDRTDKIPVTGETPERPHHEVTAGVIRDGNQVLIARRPEDGMLGGLWEFPGGKQEPGETLEEALKRELHEELGINTEVLEKWHEIPHQYSHMTINLHVYQCRIKSGSPEGRENQQWEWVPVDRLADYAFPKSNHPIVETLKERAVNKTN